MENVKKPKRRKVEKVKCRVGIKHLVPYCDHESIDTHTKAFVPFSIRIEFNRIEKLHFYLKITYWQYYLDFECDFVGFPVLRKMNTIRHVICGTFILLNNYLILQSNIALYRYSFEFFCSLNFVHSSFFLKPH